MSVVIIGGNEGMVCQYAQICRNNGCKAKIYPKEKGSLKKKLGCPDLLVLFTRTVSHKMMISATQEAKRQGTVIAHVHSSSATALQNVLKEYCRA